MANVSDGTLPPSMSQRMEVFESIKVQLYVQQMLSEYPGLANNAKFLPIVQQHVTNMVMRITTWCESGRIEDTVDSEIVEYPDGTWQTFKALHCPVWFIEKFPVRMVRKEIKKTVNHYFVCPHLVTDERNLHVQFMATGTRQARGFR